MCHRYGGRSELECCRNVLYHVFLILSGPEVMDNGRGAPSAVIFTSVRGVTRCHITMMTSDGFWRMQAKGEVKKLTEKLQNHELEAQPGRTMMESFENQVLWTDRIQPISQPSPHSSCKSAFAKSRYW